VALTKIADYATVLPGVALFALGALVFILAAMQASFDPLEVWARIQWADRAAQNSQGRGGVTDLDAHLPLTGLAQGLQTCHVCGLLSRPVSGHEGGCCPRCGIELEFRKADSIQRTTAFVIAAAVCYVPANLLPVMTTTTAAGSDSDTIMQGVVLLWSPTGWPLSLIVLFASIMIPSAKIAALVYLLITARRGSFKNNGQRQRLFRLVEAIGRWSMVDVFVDTFTVSLIQLQPLMSVAPAPGLFFFAAVVVLTMLAVESFDSRLIWDFTNSTKVNYA
jgi:paraquat-inducible protein A